MRTKGLVIIAVSMLVVAGLGLAGQTLLTNNHDEIKAPKAPMGQNVIERSHSFISDVLSEDWLAESSELTILGTVKDIGPTSETSDVRNNESTIYRDVTVSVEKVLKGNPDFANSDITVRTFGGTIGDRTQIMRDEPTYSKGERVLLFLTKSGADMPKEGNVYTALARMHGKYSIKGRSATRDNRLPSDKREIGLENLQQIIAKHQGK